MTEIIVDEKFKTVELSSSLGINLSSSSTRIKHTGTGTMAVSSAGPVTLESANTSTGITIGNTSSVPVTIASGGGEVNIGTSSSTVNINGDLVIDSDLSLGGIVYTFPSSDAAASGYVLSSDGAGTLSWVSNSGGGGGGATLTGSTNNTVVTVTGADAIQGEANLTFDGSTLAVTGAATVSTTLTVTGATSLNGGLNMDTNKFTVADTSGNVATAGTLTVTGATALNGGLTMDTNKFVVADTTGNTAIGGTLTMTGNITYGYGQYSSATSSSLTTATGNIIFVDLDDSAASPISLTLPANSYGVYFKFIIYGTTAQSTSPLNIISAGTNNISYILNNNGTMSSGTGMDRIIMGTGALSAVGDYAELYSLNGTWIANIVTSVSGSVTFATE